MRKAILLLLLITSGCATFYNSEPVNPVMKSQPVLHEEQPAQAAVPHEQGNQQAATEGSEEIVPPVVSAISLPHQRKKSHPYKSNRRLYSNINKRKRLVYLIICQFPTISCKDW